MSSTHERPMEEDGEARDILYLAGGAALVLLGAGLMMAHPVLRKSAKAAFSAFAPDLEGPFKAGVRGVIPDLERYLRLKGM
jgi:hypothetical protein